MCEVTDISGFSPRGKIYYMEERATPITQSGLYLPLPLSFIGPILHAGTAKPRRYFPLYIAQAELFTSKGKGKRP